VDLERFDEATAALRQVLAAHPEHPEARFLLAKANELRQEHAAEKPREPGGG
jgi:cytochrome c-type biogenesis protein CcmH/NrfG